jgi:hypothetical protein
MENKNPHIGSSLDNLLKEEGFLAGARATALKEALAYQGKEKHKGMEMVEEDRDYHGHRWACGNFVELVPLVPVPSIAIFAASLLMGAIYQRKFGRPPVPPTVGPSWTSRH